ncbi:hypothetical protein E2C01_080066 [Portunus trituberculatus]|uniref:Uncharacterized protein n=1 Tax=Portunus trituberculatus TaxID=210409 RepID=A0A5B7IV02_PORTR|nr:hypothetical protein [Portunus trituberculatus]
MLSGGQLMSVSSNATPLRQATKLSEFGQHFGVACPSLYLEFVFFIYLHLPVSFTPFPSVHSFILAFVVTCLHCLVILPSSQHAGQLFTFAERVLGAFTDEES